MTYRVIYDDQWFRTIPSVMIDARAGTPLANATGAVMETYIQAQLALIIPGVLTYKIETNSGNLAGVFALNVVGNVATLLFSILRPAFIGDSDNITMEISTFIQGNYFLYDIGS